MVMKKKKSMKKKGYAKGGAVKKMMGGGAAGMKKKGYATGGFGKWGAGGRDSTGVPEKHGFDLFFGYYDQVHAHSFYPPFLIRNSEEVVLPGNRGGRIGKTYSHYEIMKEGLNFIRENRERPFFCYLPITPPHGMYDIPDTDPAWALFKDKKDWPEEAKRYAAMVKMVDRNVGQVLDLLKELDLEKNTIVFFAGDNGGQDRFKTQAHPRGFFGPNVNPKNGVAFRGGKGNLYEGGLKIPSLVRWPGKISPGSVSDLLWSQVDLFPTLGELAKAELPGDLDGLSILPTLLGEEKIGRQQEQHKMLYWEFGGHTAVRWGQWKAIKTGKTDDFWALYDLSKDVTESRDVAEANREVLEKMMAFANRSHTPVQPGTFSTRTRHDRDRWAKWGDSKPPAPKLKKYTRWNRKGLLDSSQFKLVRVSSENRGNAKFARFAFDGDPRTWWHSDWSANPKKKPHEIVIDLGKVREVEGLRYLARQDGSFNGTIAKIEVRVQEKLDVEAGSVFETTFTKTRKIQDFAFQKSRGRFVILRPLSEVNSNPWASAAEFGVLGR